jgi:branched-chain amino acid transport system permease protein
MQFFVEVLVAGMLAGVMYAMVALGFVLIYKASGVFNFAQGAMVLCAALTFVSLVERHVGFWSSLGLSLAVMIAIGLAIERAVLRPLVNRPPIAMFMATLGVSYVLEGAAQWVWGAQVHGLELGIADVPYRIHGILVSKLDLFAAGTAATLVLALSLGYRYTRLGLSLRAVADDTLAALSVGIDLRVLWAAVWILAGAVALIAGLLWGARTGVQFSLSLTVLRALPVLLIGGFSSVPGTIVGGLLVGAGEKLAEVYLGPKLGGGIELWFPYLFALAFLLARPTGLFGEPEIERV